MARCAGPHKIVENTISNRLVERADVAIRREVKLQRFTFNANLVRNVIDLDPREVRLAGDRTERCKIVRFEMDAVMTFCRVRKGLQPGVLRRSRDPGLAAPEQGETFSLGNGHNGIKPTRTFSSTDFSTVGRRGHRHALGV